MVDYRHFDKENIEPLYGFGFGFKYPPRLVEGHLERKARALGSEAYTARAGRNNQCPDGWAHTT